MEEQLERPDYIFEVSWEVCNKVGGIHTVISSKALTMVNEWEDKVIMIGPDVWKGTGEHPEFKEDKTLFTSWLPMAEARGLKIKVGRWKITGNPIVILVDFTPFFTKKDEIFRDLWLRCKVDSLSGQWDYIEPALFGYAAAKVIECFYHHHITFSDKIIAQFHEWLTGVGVHYLEEHVPQIGTVFTTHATTVGRAIAGNGLPLYSKFDTYNGDQEAKTFNVVAKHSLEKTSALHADCFTTVSEITARECARFLEKKPDIITPNGFEDFIVPDAFFFREKRALARKKLLEVAQCLIGRKLPDDSLLLLKSGRYEFRNKGIDLFIDALGKLNSDPNVKREVVAFIFIPAHHTGPKKDLLERMNRKDYSNPGPDKVLTHYLQGAEVDTILNRIQQNQLDNEKGKVKVVFSPVYLSGDDGIFNMNYYDLLVGFDMSGFPSYYEPWGYTPLESLAFHIPTITTNLTGFGMILHGTSANISQGLMIIDRNDNNDIEVIDKIANTIKEYEFKNEKEVSSAREAAEELSKTALWKNYLLYYKKAYSIALGKAAKRAQSFTHEAGIQTIHPLPEAPVLTTPVWREVLVQSQLPENLKVLDKLARNLWWTWNTEAGNLFKLIDKELWDKYEHNPIHILESLSYGQIKKLEKNAEFMAKLDSVNKEFEKYINTPVNSSPFVAYFCMEYGLCSSLKLYSGGLGILAGDYLKQASDSGTNITGIGLLYRSGYFKQNISAHGEQVSHEDGQVFTSLPLQHVYDKDGNWFRVSIAFPGRTLYAKVWKVEVGRVPLYLLDTDIPQNRPEDRTITNTLYGGDWENRLKQELLLGIGGTRLLRKLGVAPDVYHYNEGHAAFAGLERLLMLVQAENISFEEALEVVRASSLFTTHTPIPAGHDTFSEDMLRAYLSFHCNLLNISWKHLMALGRKDENDQSEKFSMSYLAARLCQSINGVSLIHETVTRRLFNPIWQGYAEEELNIGHINNGIHLATWTSSDHKKLYESTFGKSLTTDISDPTLWEKIQGIPDKTLWEAHIKRKKALMDEVKKNVTNRAKGRLNVRYSTRLMNSLNEKALVIGFARRFATYKRPLLPFYNPEKFASIMTNTKYPILFLFAGKAHPNDGPGKEMVRYIVEMSRQLQFEGRILFMEDYDIELAKFLTQGVDVWLNTPEPEKEASGTSGMKAAVNGVLNFSMADGWWAEAYKEDNGWVLADQLMGNDKEMQNEQDAETFYQVLENEIIPTYFERNNEDVPVKWVGMMKKSIAGIAPEYSMHRTINEYTSRHYNGLSLDAKSIRQNNFEKAKQIAAWKQNVIHKWNGLTIVSTEVYDSANRALPLGSEFVPKITLDLNGLSPDDVGLEIIFIGKRKSENEFEKIVFANPLLPVETQGRHVVYECKIPITLSGMYEYGFRIYPKNPLIKNRLDFPLIRWV